MSLRSLLLPLLLVTALHAPPARAAMMVVHFVELAGENVTVSVDGGAFTDGSDHEAAGPWSSVTSTAEKLSLEAFSLLPVGDYRGFCYDKAKVNTVCDSYTFHVYEGPDQSTISETVQVTLLVVGDPEDPASWKLNTNIYFESLVAAEPPLDPTRTTHFYITADDQLPWYPDGLHIIVEDCALGRDNANAGTGAVAAADAATFTCPEPTSLSLALAGGLVVGLGRRTRTG